MSLALDECLESPDFLDKWEHGKFTARERRVWISRWVGEAWQKCVESERADRYFLKTGCLLPVDGSPNMIHLQGLRDYTFGPKQNDRFLIDVDSEDDDSSSSDEDTEHDEMTSEGYSTSNEEFHDDDDEKVDDGADNVIVSPDSGEELQQQWFIEDKEKVSIKMPDGRIGAAAEVELRLKSVHNHAIPENSVVVILRDVFEGADFGVHTLGEPNARPDAFIAVDRSNRTLRRRHQLMRICIILLRMKRCGFMRFHDHKCRCLCSDDVADTVHRFGT